MVRGQSFGGFADVLGFPLCLQDLCFHAACLLVDPLVMAQPVMGQVLVSDWLGMGRRVLG